MTVPAKWIPVLVGGGFAVFGVFFVVMGVRMARANSRFRARAESTTGTCVDLVYRHSSSSHDSSSTGGWAPRMVFRTLDGQQIEATSPVWSSPAAVRRGHTAPIVYDPAEPQDFRVDNLRGSGGCIAPVFIAMGSVFALVGLTVVGITAAVLSR